MISTTQTNVHRAITAANEEFMERFAQGDAAGVAALYTPDGQILPPNGEVVASPGAIEGFWRGVMDTGVGGVRLDVVEVNEHGQTASEISRYTLLGRDGQILDQGKYVVIWKQVGGQWKLHRDIFNSSRP